MITMRGVFHNSGSGGTAKRDDDFHFFLSIVNNSGLTNLEGTRGEVQ
jgi:hypothetical protein